MAAVESKKDTKDNKLTAAAPSGSRRVYGSVEHIRSVSWLYGLETAKARHAQVLVLGCGDGANLLPFVTTHPFANVVGVELDTEIRFTERLQAVNDLALANLQLYSLSLPALLENQWQNFDYIIIQNSFALLSNEITDTLLAFCQQILSPQGVIAIEWPCQPGAKTLEMVRDAVQLHSSRASSHEGQLDHGKAMLTWFADITNKHNPIKSLLKHTLKQSESISDTLFSHYFLEGKNEANYLVEFNVRIENVGLSYVGDVQPATEHADYYDEEICPLWEGIMADGGKILGQQYLDIAINRNRRFSLLTSHSRKSEILDSVDYTRLKQMRWAGSFRRVTSGIRHTPDCVAGHDAIPIATNDMTTLGILDVLGEAWPYSVSFDQLVFHTRLPDNDPESSISLNHEKKVLSALKALFKKGISGLHFQLDEDNYSTNQEHHIVVPAGVRQQLLAGGETLSVVNLWHELVEITEEEQKQLLLSEQTIDEDNLALLDGLHRKGLLSASVLGWKRYLQQAAGGAELIDVGRLACSLLLFSSDTSAGGFYTQDFERLAKKARRDAEEELDDSIDGELVLEINKFIIKGNNKNAIELVEQERDRLLQTVNGNYYLARFYKRVGDHASVILALTRMLSFHSTSAFIYSELAMALYDNRMSWQAGRVVRTLLRCDRKSSPDWYLLSILHKESKTYERAEYCARQAYELAPESKQIVNLLGSCLCEQAKTDEGIAFLRRAIKDPIADYGYYGSLAFILTHSGQASAAEIFECHLAYAKGLMAWVDQQTFKGYEPVDKSTTRKLRIGFVSGDFKDNHPVSFYFSPIWDALDRRQFELYGYNSAPAYARNAGTDRFESSADKWREVRHTSTLELAEMIKEDQIDILVDLAGHTGHNRLATFALKPAPVQISWVGYHATTGLPAMDYYATIFPVPKDPTIEAQFVEKLIYLSLPRNFGSKDENQPINPLPALENGYFTFGSFNRPNKINDDVLDIWADILKRVPTSRMIIGNMARVLWADIYQKLRDRGIDDQRIMMREAMGLQQYLQAHNDVDLLLDTFPFTGGTVTSHAAWMGVPTISLAGETLVSRQGASIMHSLGLSDFIARNKVEYIMRATNWSEKLEELNAIRIGLRDRMKIGHDQKELIATYVGKMFHECWRRYCFDETPESFSIGEVYDVKK
ncbi:methyltransferase regulatory domain-containing protein [Pectobacterium brasiliense]|uniref:O-linked N-acetylglucosamine transferase family protein n=1 Tax=Pectobacterium brasiliense TaxID=180957 RepID=UPI001D0CE995|nr:methyltransferase regulatory domain-containing protein [Pectobacterium brasiliense]UDQ74496.1 methyltransferase regulatory domain-containing protein [Pectobacterium brasiliense]